MQSLLFETQIPPKKVSFISKNQLFELRNFLVPLRWVFQRNFITEVFPNSIAVNKPTKYSKFIWLLFLRGQRIKSGQENKRN